MAARMLVTPKGSAEWPKLWTPDVKFTPLGQYSINLKVKEDEAEALTTELNRQVDACYKAELKKNPKLKTKMTKRLPYEQCLDDEGEETGFVEFKIKMKARVEMKNGDSFTQRPAVYDAKGQLILKSIDIGNGSICKVAFETVPYMLASTKEASVSLRLKSVQLIELRTYNSEENPFDTEEGYTFEEDTSPFAQEDSSGSNTPKEASGIDGAFDEEEDEDF